MKHFTRKLKSQGFAHVELVLLLIVVVGISTVGYYVYKHNLSYAGNTYTTLAAITADNHVFTEQACITAQSGTSPNYTDTVTALISVNTSAGRNSSTKKHRSYNPLAYYSVNGVTATKDNWTTAATSTITFNLPPMASTTNFTLGVEGTPGSTLKTPGSTQTMSSIGLCNPPAAHVVVPAPTVTMSASPSTISSGATSTVTWTSTNATSCTASGAWSGSQLTAGTYTTAALSASSSYNLACTGSGGNASTATTVSVTAASTPGTTKLLGMNAHLTDTYNSQTTEVGILQQLGVNSERGEIDFNGTSFGNPSADGTTANWIDTLTSGHIVPLPLLNQYIELSTLNVSGFVSSTVSWCKTYCAGGTFYSGNTAADANYAPQILEILNEPYGNWWGVGSPTTTDIAAYATLLKDLRTALNSAGLSTIGITAAANDNYAGTTNWDTDLLADGGFGVVQGVVVHPYGDVDLATDTSGTNDDGWGQVYYVHQLLVNAGLSANANLYLTEDGWCTDQAAAPAGYTVGNSCVGGSTGFYTEAQKDSNIGLVISQLASVSWIKGLWYYNLYPYDVSGSWSSFGLYNPGTWNSSGLYVSGAQTPAWTAFQSAAQTAGL